MDDELKSKNFERYSFKYGRKENINSLKITSVPDSEKL